MIRSQLGDKQPANSFLSIYSEFFDQIMSAFKEEDIWVLDMLCDDDEKEVD